jgi:hypothetical protein
VSVFVQNIFLNYLRFFSSRVSPFLFPSGGMTIVMPKLDRVNRSGDLSDAERNGVLGFMT